MLFSSYRRHLFRLYQQTYAITKHNSLPIDLHTCSYIQQRSTCYNQPQKRKILLKINTVLNETADMNDDEHGGTDMKTIACLNNELILPENMVRFPFHYRCIIEQQWAIWPDRWVPKNEWQELYDIIGDMTKPLFASITLLVCVQNKHVERGRSLFQYIEQVHGDLLRTTSTTCATYMNLLALDFFQTKKDTHENNYSPYENELLRVYETFVKSREKVSKTYDNEYVSFSVILFDETNISLCHTLNMQIL
jgi:hypothetical protein